MSSPSTHQDSPKVPVGGWPSVLHVVEIGPGSTPPSFRARAEDTWLPELAKQPYLSVSALLSDEFLKAFRRGLPNAPATKSEVRIALQAAIELVGGGQGA